MGFFLIRDYKAALNDARSAGIRGGHDPHGEPADEICVAINRCSAAAAGDLPSGREHGRGMDEVTFLISNEQ